MREFYELEARWRELYAHASDASPFRSWDFTVEWFRHFVLGRVGGATGRFEIVLALDEHGRVIGAVPMFEERSLGSAAFGLTLQPFGRSGAMETMTDEPIVLFRRGCEAAAARALAEYIGGEVSARGWDLAVIPGAPEIGTAGRRSFTWPRRLNSVELSRPAIGTMPLSLPRTWGAFTAGLSKSMRDNIAYYPKRLSREVGDWKLRRARSVSEIAVATTHLIDLHRRRSHSETRTAHYNHIGGEVGASFLRAWFARAAARGEISIQTIEIGGETIAAQAFVEMPGCVSVYYSGYDERYYRYSPLTIITAHVIRSAIERGIRRFEFPPGSTTWTSRWGAKDGPVRDEVSIYSTRIPALLRGISRRLHFRFSVTRLVSA